MIFYVDSDIATSIALIINELLQNSLQYAFEGMNEGQVRIVVKLGDSTHRSRSLTMAVVSMSPNPPEPARSKHCPDPGQGQAPRNLAFDSGPGGTTSHCDFKNQIMDIVRCAVAPA
jgi:hypothetical protein